MQCVVDDHACELVARQLLEDLARFFERRKHSGVIFVQQMACCGALKRKT
jgi:hypothetical protein